MSPTKAFYLMRQIILEASCTAKNEHEVPQPLPKCEHDTRFREVLGIPCGYNGCVACLAEHQNETIDKLIDIFVTVDS